MSSKYSSRWHRILHKYAKFLFKICGDGNYHWRFDRLCFCRENEHIIGGERYMAWRNSGFKNWKRI